MSCRAGVWAMPSSTSRFFLPNFPPACSHTFAFTRTHSRSSIANKRPASRREPFIQISFYPPPFAYSVFPVYDSLDFLFQRELVVYCCWERELLAHRWSHYYLAWKIGNVKEKSKETEALRGRGRLYPFSITQYLEPVPFLTGFELFICLFLGYAQSGKLIALFLFFKKNKNISDK